MNGKLRDSKFTSSLKRHSKSISDVPSTANAKHASRPSNDSWRGEARDAIILSLSSLKDASDATGLLGPLKATCALIVGGMETARAIQKNKEAWLDLAQELDQQHQGIQSHIKQIDDRRSLDNNLRTILSAYVDSLEVILSRAQTAKEYSQAGFVRRIGRVRIDAEQVTALTESAQRAYKQFMAREAMSLLLHQDMNEVKQLIAELRLPTSESGMIGPDDPFFTLVYGTDLEVCQEGTRVRLLEHIRGWAANVATSKQIFWLGDMAGVGKTTVAATMMQEWKKDGRLAGRFFFTPNSRAASGISEFCLTIAKDMIALVKPLRNTLRNAILDTPSSHFGFEEKFEKLVTSPLVEYDKEAILIIDALDNCDFEGRKKLLETLVAVLPKAPKLKIFITSRPIPDIEKILNIPSLVENHKDLQDTDKDDIRAYVESQLKGFDREVKETVIIRSDGLFIWAFTACHLLKNSRRPKEVIKNIDGRTAGSVDKVYLEVMNQASGDAHEREMLMMVLRIITSAFEPISVAIIQELMPQVDDVATFVEDLGSVLRSKGIDQPIQIIHPTFREFLSDSSRSKDFHIDLASSHALMTTNCLQSLRRTLIFDMLRLIQPGHSIPSNDDVPNLETRIGEKLSPMLAYTSMQWPYHAAESMGAADVILEIELFLHEMLLNWIELASWRGKTGQCLMALSHLTSATQGIGASQTYVSVYEDLLEASNFIQRNQGVLRRAALQVYSSSLVFTDTRKPMWKNYRKRHGDILPTIHAYPANGHNEAGNTLLTGHTGPVDIIRLFPDEKRMITASSDGAFRFWDIASGADIMGPLVMGNSAASALAFSSSGKLLLLGSRDGGVALRNANSGDLLSLQRDAHGGGITCVQFSSDDLIAISASKGNIIKIWDTSVETLVATGKEFTSQESICSVSFIPNGHGVLSAWGSDKLIYWDPNTSTSRTITHPSFMEPVESMTFSPDGSILITSHTNYSLLIWDGITITYKSALFFNMDFGIFFHEAHVCFSASGGYLAAACDEVSLWRLSDDVFQRVKLRDAPSRTRALAFSSDSTRLASISPPRVCIWETSTGDILFTVATTDPMTLNIGAALPHDLSFAALGSDQGPVHVHKLSIVQQGPTSHCAPLVRVKISSDQKYIVSNSEDGSLQLWRMPTGEAVWTAKMGSLFTARELFISPDNELIFIVGWNSSVRLWTMKDGKENGLLVSNSILGSPMAVALSQDGTLAIGYEGPTSVQVWSASAFTAGQPASHNITTTQQLRKMVFSMDSELLAIVFGNEVEILEVSSSRSIGVLSNIYGMFTEVVFSPRRDLLVITDSYSTQVDVWDISNTPMRLHRILGHEERPTFPLTISPDSKYLVWGSTIWNISGTTPEQWTDSVPPSSLQLSGRGLESFLSYKSGWIYSLNPQGRLFLIPEHVGVHPTSYRPWSARGNIIVFGTTSGVPLIVDCSPLLR